MAAGSKVAVLTESGTAATDEEVAPEVVCLEHVGWCC